MQLSPEATKRRARWVAIIEKLSGSFSNDTDRMTAALEAEITQDGPAALRDHLHTCGAIPELYRHDSSEEKLYSKYTDVVLNITFNHIGLTSRVFTARADSADVIAAGPTFSFVADAKAFRLSRTAKNQKDFKVSAMHGWKQGSDFAIVVCPMYQLPSSASQIYAQATANDVCILTYSHLALLVSLSEDLKSPKTSVSTLHKILLCVRDLNSTKDAVAYWTNINRIMLASHKAVGALWQDEKQASITCLESAKKEAREAITRERVRILQMSKEDAVNELLLKHNVEGRLRAINAVSPGRILEHV